MDFFIVLLELWSLAFYLEWPNPQDLKFYPIQLLSFLAVILDNLNIICLSVFAKLLIWLQVYSTGLPHTQLLLCIYIFEPIYDLGCFVWHISILNFSFEVDEFLVDSFL